MNNTMKKIDYLRDDEAADITELNEVEYAEIDINAGLNDALMQLESLKSEYKSIEVGNLVDQCKNTVIETVVGQFGLASVFIRCQEGGNVTTSHNFEKGVTSSAEDAAKYQKFKENNDGSRKWSDVRVEGGYDDPLPGMRKEAFKTQDVIIDEYTGKPLPKDGRAHLDHIVSAKEIEGDPRANLFQTPEERAKMATDKENLAWTEGSANQSKGDQKMEEWLDKEKNGQTNEERFGIDRERAMKKDRAARKHIKNTLNKAALKKYSKELLVTGGKDAAKVAAYQVLGVLMRELIQGVFQEVKYTVNHWGKEKLADVYRRFKERLSALVKKITQEWKDLLADSAWTGIQAFLSNIVVFVVNLFATTLKKIVSMIRAGFVSLTEAIKIMVHPPEGMPREEVNYQALKILTAGLIGAATMGLSAGIDSLLLSIPGLQPLMAFPIPLVNRTVSDVLSVTLSALAGGILTTIALYYMDKIYMTEKKAKLSLCIAAQSGVVAKYQVLASWSALKDGYGYVYQEAARTKDTIEVQNQEMTKSGAIADAAITSVDAALADLKNLMKK